MRTIFITPLLWKRFDRAALRRGEDGQALVLIALVVVGMVAMVGLAIDGGLGYLEATKLQRAADAAALSGVAWMPDNRPVADARAQLAAEANDVKVACYYDSSKADNDVYNQRCRRADWATVQQRGPNELYYFESSQPQGLGIQYQVTLGKMQQRWFLGVLGFPNYPILRTATAEISRLIRFGSSFNYFGTNGVLYDHYMRCDPNNPQACAGNGSDLNMYGTTYQRYVLMRCEQPNPPTPCIGGFWGHIAGPDLIHSSGDAFNPIRDGADPNVQAGSGPLGGVKINTNSGYGTSCIHTSDPSTWFVTNIYAYSGSGNGCSPKNGTSPVYNFETHPDSPNQDHGFGYEIAIEVDPNAIYNYDDTVKNVANHTNLNVTIYDGAEAELGNTQIFGTSDNFQGSQTYYGTSPYSGFTKQNRLSPAYNTSYWQSKKFLSDQTPANRTVDPTDFPDPNNLNLTYNDMRTRLTLYGPPTNKSIPSTYGNVSGYQLGQFEITDMSVRTGDVQMPIEDYSAGSANNGSNDALRYCYVIFDGVKVAWNNTQVATANPAPGGQGSTPGTGGPDYAYSATSTPMPQASRYAYVCPVNGTSPTDYRWNQLKGTPTARFLTVPGFQASSYTDYSHLNIMSGIVNPTDSVNNYPMLVSPVVTGTLPSSSSGYGPYDPSQAGVNSIWSLPSSTYKQTVDPAQDCRRSAVDQDNWPIDPMWGHNRIPFNMAYGDPLVNRAWYDASNKSAGYYTLYYSFHGWRCDWDFDSNYTMNPLQNSSLPPDVSTNKSLSQAERTGQPGQFDKAFVMGHPGLTSNTYLQQVLGQNGVGTTQLQQRETLPAPGAMDRDYGLEPYFHLTNVGFNGGGALSVRPGFNKNNAPVRDGTYMLQVQVYGGSGANRYSVKAEYENPKTIVNTESATAYNVVPVPNVYAVTAMAIYANAANTGGRTTQNVIFDMAYIPPENAGTKAILELWDPGDVSGTLALQILKPSTWGPRVDYHGSKTPKDASGNWLWEVHTGDPLNAQLTVCPYALNVDALGLNATCFTNALNNSATTMMMTSSGNQYYNDQWMMVSFTIPTSGEYNDMKAQCANHNVPENMCYYFQINYQLTGANAVANDTTTWQLVVQGQPVHLVTN
ncbi:MAG TPA: Tad domain-containing protein [Chloroflexia bacterium]|nr:Tad domain-containing protein [Chloroflexia bacterium]